jgi:hypothetical protein
MDVITVVRQQHEVQFVHNFLEEEIRQGWSRIVVVYYYSVLWAAVV